ncbi:MAG: type II toxin-antitoxin system VapC family toxin [Candidatus Riflebacteria bacterium]|nr:type II toxin-antitoxin system VapC family toxin [Candidatus Riflebacteria bacterium]
MKAVFVDTSASVALRSRSELHHLAASRSLGTPAKGSIPLVTSNFVLDETYTLLKGRYGACVAIRFGDGLRESAWVWVQPVEAALQERAWQIFKRTRDQDFSFTDCTSFAVMESLRLDQAFTFDRGFQRFGLRPVPEPG